MDWLIIPGIIVTFIGLGLLFYTIARIMRAKKQGLNDDDMKVQLQSAIAWNLALWGALQLG